MAQSLQIKAVNWRHERLADLMISEPHLTLGEIAVKLGISQVWLSIVKNSDAFKDYWVLRSKAHSDALTAGIREKAAALTEMSLDVLLSDVESKVSLGVMSAREARENLDVVRKFGFDGSGGAQVAPATVNLNFGLVSQEALAQARDRLRRTIEPTVEAEVLPLPREEGSK